MHWLGRWGHPSEAYHAEGAVDDRRDDSYVGIGIGGDHDGNPPLRRYKDGGEERFCAPEVMITRNNPVA
jgi:hypothetical protein